MKRDAGSKLMTARRTSSRKSASFLPFSLKFLSFAILIPLLITIIMLIASAENEVMSVLIELPLSSQVFTPLNLFFLLNLLIISIILITHFHKDDPLRKEGPPARAPASATSSRHALSAASLLDLHDVQRFRGHYAEKEAQDPAEEVRICDDCQGRADTYLSESRSGHEQIEMPLNLARSDHMMPLNLEEVLLSLAESDAQQHSMNSNNAAADFVEGAKQFKSSEQWSCTLGQERPLASTHFTHKKTTNRVHASKSPLKISRPSVRKGDTLDATWKAICESKANYSSPIRHHIASRTRKADCHTNGGHKVQVTCTSKESQYTSCLSPSKQRHRMPHSSTNGLIRRREPSISRDELNARVESFISKFNQQIKIQREQSLLSHKKMVNRGAK